MELWVQWPPGRCVKFACRRHSIPRRFTIHGLWPTNFHDGRGSNAITGLTGPNISYVPDLENKLASHTNDLQTNWPNLNPNNNDSTFWLHEWNRHGTASHLTLNVEEYFNKALELHLNNDILRILRRGNIFPGNTYQPQDYVSALTMGLHTIQVMS
ncbi:hypothetical protein ACFE04_014631 [Oxalis oulophora]